MITTPISLNELVPVTNRDLAVEAKRVAMAAHARAFTWQSHPTYDTKSAVLGEVDEAIAQVSMVGRLLAGGSWTQQQMVLWTGVDIDALYKIRAIVKSAKRGSDMGWLPVPCQD